MIKLRDMLNENEDEQKEKKLSELVQMLQKYPDFLKTFVAYAKDMFPGMDKNGRLEYLSHLNDQDRQTLIDIVHQEVKRGREKTEKQPTLSDYEAAATRAAFAAQERELRRRNRERHYGWAPGSADYDDV